MRAIAITPTRFEPRTLAVLVNLLLARRAAISRSAETLRREAVDALSERDLSDLYDLEDPSADSDAAELLMQVQRAERRLWEVEQALARVIDGTYGHCTGCGVEIPLERLRVVPATLCCVACSGRTIGPIPRDRSRTQSSPEAGASVLGAAG